MNRADWNAFVDKSEHHAFALTLEDRNLIFDAAAHIDWLESRKRHSEGHVALLRIVIESVVSILVQRDQPGWEQRILTALRAALKETKV